MKASTLRRVRQFHNYLAVFFAPAILFFAFTGALQTIGLHEAHSDAPPPPRWIAAIASLHKHQVIAGPRRRPGGGGAPANGTRPRPTGGGRDEHGFNALKPFVLLVSVALFATTLLGLVIALTNRAGRRLSWLLLVAGTALPLALLLA